MFSNKVLAFTTVFAFSMLTASGSAHVDEPAGEATITDPIEDVEYRTQDGHLTRDPGQYPEQDILTVRMRSENQTHLALDMKLAEHQLTTGTVGSHQFHFRFGDLAYRVITHSCAGGPWALQMATSAETAEDAWSYVACLEGDISERPDIDLTAFVPHRLVLDEQGGPLRGGSHLLDFHADTLRQGVSVPDSPFWVVDRAPDEGTVAGIQIEASQDAQAAGFQLNAAHPIRFSNGGAGTIVIGVVADNLGDETRDLAFGVSGTRPEWDVLAPNTLSIPPGDSVSFPVLVTVPFSHQHGATDRFNLFAAAPDDPTVRDEISLGIHYPRIPQPAGHHSVLYFHSGRDDVSGGLTAWVNAATPEEYPEASYDPMGPYSVTLDTSTGGSRATWQISLRPELRIGLSFDSSKDGVVQYQLAPGGPIVDATVQTAVYLCDPGAKPPGTPAFSPCPEGTWRLLGRSEEETVSSTSGATIDVAQQLDFSQAPDRYDFERGANMHVVVLFNRTADPSGLAMDHQTRLVTQGSSIELPLLEYGHPLGEQYTAARLLGLSLDKPDARFVNPGRTLAYNVSVENLGKDHQNVRVSHVGHNAAWARWEGPTDTTVAPGTSAVFGFFIAAPPGAAEHEFAELTLVASNVDDPSIVTLAGLRAQVTTTQSVPDESEPPAAGSDADPDASASGFVAIGTSMALLAAAAWHQRVHRYR